MEQSVSPDSDTNDFADIYRPDDFMIIHSQYVRGGENEVVSEDDKRNLPEIDSL